MAERIQKIKRIQYSEEQILKRDLDEVKQAVSENKTAILKGIGFLNTLESQGMLDMIDASLKQKEEILTNVVTEVNKEQYSSILDNAGNLLFLMGQLDVGAIEQFMGKINSGLEVANETQSDEKTSYTKMLRALKDPEVNRSVTTLLNFMKGMGKEG